MEPNAYTAGQRTGMLLLRLFIGWHFLYEGIIKLYTPSWTAKGYLLSAEFLPGLFRWLAGDTLINWVDYANIFLLVFVGLSLMLGLFTKLGALAGMGLLILYYLAHPAFPGLEQGATEGTYFIINKNLIECVALWVIYLFPMPAYGLGRFFNNI